MYATLLTDPSEFLERAKPLLEDEARNSLVLGIARGVLRDPDRFEDSGLFLVEYDGVPVVAALITPPFNLLVSQAANDDAVRVLVGAVHDNRPSIPGVTGDRESAETFMRGWMELTGAKASLEMEQGVFSIETVQEVQAVAGGPRRATMDDVDMIIRWMLDFAAEALPRGVEDAWRFESITRRRLEGASQAGFWLWEVGGMPVAISGQSGPTGTGIRINGVYTPPDLRRNGYATALVAHQTQSLLKAGYERCFLYTDLANPTSNAIYRRIGYQQVAESVMYRFS